MPYNNPTQRHLMTSKTPLQQEIQNLRTEVQNLEAKLRGFREQLNQCKEVTIETASIGDTLEDGCVVLQKENGLALLAAPKSTEVHSEWSKEFAKVFEKLKDQGFNPSQFFIPTKEQLQLAQRNVPDEFSASIYWSSTESSAACAYRVNLLIGRAIYCRQMNTYNELFVRAFRCVTY
jgi:peptidoglycan hydrolase CwlO-like protein